MTARLSSLRKNRLLPIVAVLSSVLLLTGESLNCCRLNQSISQSIQKLFAGRHNHTISIQDENADHDAHCHGHAHETALTGSAPDAYGASLTAPSTCISEYSLSTKPMLQGEFSILDLPTLTPAVHLSIIPVAPFRLERPRPQNKSSPPLYLTTLRILV